MARCGHFLPGFRASCVTICVTHGLLGGGLLLKGVEPSMAEFAVPPVVLTAPHYHDAIVWVYTHQIVIGLLIGAMGLLITEPVAQRRAARLILALHVMYTVLDARSSDSVFGNGLYQGPGSIIPALIGLSVVLLFIHPSVCRAEARA